MPRPQFRLRGAGVLGLFWVYFGVLWLFWGWLWLDAGAELPVLGMVAIRLLLTLGIGLGLCALERGAWAGALLASVLHAALAAPLGALLAWSLWTRPLSALAWRPLVWGLDATQCEKLLPLTALTVGAAALNILVLAWRHREFDVAKERFWTTLTHEGLWRALPLLAIDLVLFAGWWTTHSVRG